jgi:hypothetical protein
LLKHSIFLDRQFPVSLGSWYSIPEISFLQTPLEGTNLFQFCEDYKIHCTCKIVIRIFFKKRKRKDQNSCKPIHASGCKTDRKPNVASIWQWWLHRNSIHQMNTSSTKINPVPHKKTCIMTKLTLKGNSPQQHNKMYDFVFQKIDGLWQVICHIISWLAEALHVRMSNTLKFQNTCRYGPNSTYICQKYVSPLWQSDHVPEKQIHHVYIRTNTQGYWCVVGTSLFCTTSAMFTKSII